MRHENIRHGGMKISDMSMKTDLQWHENIRHDMKTSDMGHENIRHGGGKISDMGHENIRHGAWKCRTVPLKQLINLHVKSSILLIILSYLSMIDIISRTLHLTGSGAVICSLRCSGITLAK